MPYICYKEKRFNGSSRNIIDHSNAIIQDMRNQGFTLTLRQLYYQLVSRNIVPNTELSYKRVGNIINEARLAGEVDWTAIEDRTRNIRSPSHWDTPADIIDTCVASYAIDKWDGQPCRPEVWIEKDALVGVIDGICRELDISYFSCRGYTSQSEMWSAAQRLDRVAANTGATPIIIHLGDHDPSGKDMTRDIEDRLRLFMTGDFEMNRIALTMDQIEEHDPPPNPAKTTDSRYKNYMEEFGEDSWELDALTPNMIVGLIRSTVAAYRKDDMYDARVELQERGRDYLRGVRDRAKKKKFK